MSDHEFDFEICNSSVRPIAEELIKKYEELRHIYPEKILFVLNHKSPGSRKKVMLTATTSCLDDNQMTALVYRELRSIGPEGNIVSPDTNEWWTGRN